MPIVRHRRPYAGDGKPGRIRQSIAWMHSPLGHWIGYDTVKLELTRGSRTWRKSWSVSKWGEARAWELAEKELRRWRRKLAQGKVPYRSARRGRPRHAGME